MSFFGFESSHHNPAAAGFSQAHDPFAGLANRDEDGEVLEFDDTYDGLGDQLEETGDELNDDTFGDTAVGKDFDFFGQTAKVSTAIEEEQARFNRIKPPTKASQPTTQPTSKPSTAFYSSTQATSSYTYSSQTASSKPLQTGYEKYKSEPVAELQVDPTLWGVAPKKQSQASTTPAVSASASSIPPNKKVLSVEEVEAQLRAQAKNKAQQAAASPAPQPAPGPATPTPVQAPMQHMGQYPPGYQFPQHGQPQLSVQQDQVFPGQAHPVTILQRPQSKPAPSPQPIGQPPAQLRQQPSAPVQPTHILQNPNRLSGDGAKLGIPQQPTSSVPGNYPAHQNHRQQSSLPRQPPIITHPSQLAQLTDEEKAAYLEQEARRAKRNHKIFLMSRDNGLMTPQDKSFVTRIQLQQLVAATGNPNEHGTDEALAEDFYYQVHTQIQGGHRQHPSQPLNNFAQTYLYQTGARQGGRRHRGPENHLQRMEQQVQRAVEAAKTKPKNKQLVIEGSLGKISFSNAKTPKPLLNIKRPENGGDANRPASAHKQVPQSGDRKSELRSLELIYTTLMKMEDHDRTMPSPPANEADSEAIQQFVTWNSEAQILNTKLWNLLRVHDHPENGVIHPFIALLSYSKGKKAMPRVFRHLTQEQRTTILTLIILNLDNLDVVRGAQVSSGNMQLNAAMRENVELFSVAVMSTLFNVLNELDLDLVAGVLGLVCTRNVDVIAKSRIGASMLTMILSRAEIIKHSGAGSEQAWRSWYVEALLVLLDI